MFRPSGRCPHPEWGLSAWARGPGPGGSLASPSPPGPAHIPTLKHPRVRVQFSGWTQVHGRHGERAGRAIGPRAPLFPPPHPRVGPVLPTEVSVWSRVDFPTQRGPGGPGRPSCRPTQPGLCPSRTQRGRRRRGRGFSAAFLLSWRGTYRQQMAIVQRWLTHVTGPPLTLRGREQ